jgi:hypothetical protein
MSRDGEPALDRLTPDALVETLRNLPPGTTELCTHPGEPNERGAYSGQRPIELETLCDPRIREAVAANNITLISFSPPAPHPLAQRVLPHRRGWRDVWRRICGIKTASPQATERSFA